MRKEIQSWIDLDTAMEVLDTIWGDVFDNRHNRSRKVLQAYYGDRLTDDELLNAWQILPIREGIISDRWKFITNNLQERGKGHEKGRRDKHRGQRTGGRGQRG